MSDLCLNRDIERRRRLIGQQTGLQSSDMAIIARWRMPPELMGYIPMRRSASGMRTCSSIAVA
jgi:hypothetical protein